MSSAKRPERGVIPTWPLLLLHPPHPFIWMPSTCHTTIAARSVDTHIPTTSAKPKVNNAMPAVVTTTTQPCASNGDANPLANTLHEEVTKTSLPDVVLAGLMDNADPAALLTGTAAVALPGPLLTVLHAAHPIVHHPGSLASLIAMPPHTGTTRTLLKSFLPSQVHLAITLKACSLLRVLPMAR